MMPTRSAEASASPSAVHRVRPSALRARVEPVSGTGVAAGSGAATGRVEVGPGPGRAQRDRGQTVPVSVPVGLQEQRGRGAPRVEGRARPWADRRRSRPAGAPSDAREHHGLVPVAGGAPASRRSSAARVGPRWAASARPRPSSSATTAASTPEASGSSPSNRHPQLAPAGRPRRPRPASPSARDRPGPGPCAGPSRTTTAATVVAERALLGREADVHQLSARAESSRGVHSSRRVRRRTLPDGSRGMASTTTNVAEAACTSQRVGDELLQLVLPDRAGRVELDDGDRHLAGPVVGQA